VSTNNTTSRRARKRTAKREKQAQLSSARAILALECDGDVPEQWRGLNLHNTLVSIDIARQERERGQQKSAALLGSPWGRRAFRPST